MEQEHTLAYKPVMWVTEGLAPRPEDFPPCRYEVLDTNNDQVVGYITNKRALGRPPSWEVSRIYHGVAVAAHCEYPTEQEGHAAIQRLLSPAGECSECEALRKDSADLCRDFTSYRPQHTDRRWLSRWYKEDRNQRARLEEHFHLAEAKYEHHRMMHSVDPNPALLSKYENIIRRGGRLGP